MNTAPQNTLEFLSKFIALSSNANEWECIKNSCEDFVEKVLLPSQFPNKTEVRTRLSGILRRIHLLNIFPEFIGKKIICYIGCSTTKNEYHDQLDRIPEIVMHGVKSQIFNTSGGRMEKSTSEIVQILRSLSNKNDTIGAIFSARFVPANEEQPNHIVKIKLSKNCSPQTVFFKDFIEAADYIVFDSEKAPIAKVTCDYRTNYRPKMPIKNDDYLQKDGIATSYTFLFQWALQPILVWLVSQNDKFKKIEQSLTNDLIMIGYNDTDSASALKQSIEVARCEIKKELSELENFEKQLLSRQQELVNKASELDSNILRASNVRFVPYIDDWTRAEEQLLYLADINNLKDLNILINNLRGDYPYDDILDCVSSLARSNANNVSISSNILKIERQIAYKLCIRLRNKLGITDDEAGNFAKLITCETSEEHYLLGLALMNEDVQKASSSLRKALELGHREAGTVLYNCLSLIYNNDPEGRKKTENFLLNAFVPEMCFEKINKGKRYYSPDEIFYLYVSASQEYIPAIRALAVLESKKSSTKSMPEKEQNLHRNRAIKFYQFIEENHALDETECFFVGYMLYKLKRYKESIKYFKQSNNEKSLRYLGDMYYYGQGVRISYNKAKTFYDEAAKKGDLKSSTRLEKIKNKEMEKRNKRYAKTDEDYSCTSRSYSSSSSSGCFLTTATCKAMNYDDDCDVLQAYRHYRDEILAKDKDGTEIIKQYYRIAPDIVKKIEELHNPMEIYIHMWYEYLLPGYNLLLEKRYTEAKNLYIKLVTSLIKKFNIAF